MEFLLFLLYPAGFVAALGGLFAYLMKSQEGRRSLRIAKAHLTPTQDIEAGYAAVAASMKALRKAKQEEHQLLVSNWQNSYLELLPDTDPEKSTHLARRQGVKIETARFELDKNGFRKKDDTMSIVAGHITAASLRATHITVSDDLDEWKPFPDRAKRDPDEELSYGDRRIQRAGAFVRSAPSTSASTYGVAEGGNVVHFDGYVHGEAVDGNTVWFVYIGKGSGLPKYVHSIATTNRSTSGMANLTDPGNLDPDQMKELERTPAIVRNYQKERYNTEPKTKIPSTLTRTWY